MELLNKKITEQQQQKQMQQSQPPVAAALGINPQQAETVAGVARPTRERQVIWQGVLEWQEKNQQLLDTLI
jgi:hypothetical protein